jgi:drug/metabolite transporter (DMT)-like permease
VTRHAASAKPHRLAFPALLLGNVALAFGPWLVRLSDVGPVATGFWRVTIALPFLWLVAKAAGQQPHWPRRTLITAILIAAIFYVLDLAAWNAGIRMTKLGNATLFGNTGSFVFAIYGLWLAHRLPSAKQGSALVLAIAGAGLLMSGSYELSPRNFTGDLLTLSPACSTAAISFSWSAPAPSSSRCRCCSSPPCSGSRCCWRSAPASASGSGRTTGPRSSSSLCRARCSGRGF